MYAYFLRRLLLIIPTLFGILTINFIIIQSAPGGPVERAIARMNGTAADATLKMGSSSEDGSSFSINGMQNTHQNYQGSQGLNPEFIQQIEKMYGFDQPIYVRFWKMIGQYLTFDLGHSYFRDISVIQLIKEKLPVSISLGFWSTLIIYSIAIPLGIRKAIYDGSTFDIITSTIIIISYAIPSFLFALILIVLFAGGSFWDLFPLRGLTSEHWSTLSWTGKIADYFWHITLPIFALVISGFASLTLLTKNSFLEEISKNYVTTARAKGLSERKIRLKHIFRNAMLLVVSSLPASILHIFFTGSLLIEVIFSLDGLGLMGFESAINRDYPVVFGSLYFFSLLGLVVHVVADLCTAVMDPRIDFETTTR